MYMYFVSLCNELSCVKVSTVDTGVEELDRVCEEQKTVEDCQGVGY